MPGNELRLQLHIDAQDTDPEDRADDVQSLRSLLDDLDMDAEPVFAGPPPAGAKAALSDVITGIELVVSVPVIVIRLADIFEWVGRHRRRRLRITSPEGETITVPDTPLEEAQRILPVWASRLSKPAD